MNVATRLLCTAVFGAAALSFGSIPPATAANDSRPAAAPSSRNVTLTVFADFATVRDIRTLNLSSGVNRVAFPGISPLIAPQTAFFTDLASNHPIWVVEQDFNTDLVSSYSLLHAFIGKSVTIVRTNPTTGAETTESALVISADGPILKIGNRIETGIPAFGRIAYPSIPTSLHTLPTFEASIGTTAPGTPRVALTYISAGLSWSADYILRLNQAVDRADIDVLATVTNTTGQDFDGASLQLVSGDVQRAQAETQSYARVLGKITVDAMAANTAIAPSRRGLLEFYLYKVPRPTSLLDKQAKQFTLLTASNVPVHQTFEVHKSNASYMGAASDTQPLEVFTFLDFTNAGPALGIPLPNGIVHMYQGNASGTSEFVGDDAIGRTPRLAPVRLGLGQSFDITAKYVQTDYHRIVPEEGSRPPFFTYDDTSHRITLNNGKTKPVTVVVLVDLQNEWVITAENLPHVKIAAGEVKWTVTVPASGSTQIEYSVRTKE